MTRIADKWMIPLLLIAGIFLSFNLNKGKKIWGTAFGDKEGYYSYLPGLFIYGNLKAGHGGDAQWIVACCKIIPDGRFQNRYPYGVAVMQLPFFLGAHAVAHMDQGDPPPDWLPVAQVDRDPEIHRQYDPVRGYATGYSSIYMKGILISGVVYLCIGLWFVKEYLKRHFSTGISLTAVLMIFLGTNLYYYSLGEPGMSHVYSFALVAGIVWALPRFWESPGWGRAFFLAFCLALLCAIRPSNVIVALIFILHECYTPAQLKERLSLIWQLKKYSLAFLCAMLVIGIPQLLLFHAMWDQWFPYTYGNESFIYWSHPQVGNVWFSHQNGLFMYSPILLLIAPGLYLGFRQRRGSPLMVLVLFLLATYVFASWWAWWFGGAFGHRCFVEFLPLLALPLALVAEWVWKQKQRALKAFWVGALLFFMFCNVKMSYIYRHTKVPWDGPQWTWKTYWKQWDKTLSLFQNWP